LIQNEGGKRKFDSKVDPDDSIVSLQRNAADFSTASTLSDRTFDQSAGSYRRDCGPKVALHGWSIAGTEAAVVNADRVGCYCTCWFVTPDRNRLCRHRHTIPKLTMSLRQHPSSPPTRATRD